MTSQHSIISLSLPFSLSLSHSLSLSLSSTHTYYNTVCLKKVGEESNSGRWPHTIKKKVVLENKGCGKSLNLNSKNGTALTPELFYRFCCCCCFKFFYGFDFSPQIMTQFHTVLLLFICGGPYLLSSLKQCSVDSIFSENSWLSKKFVLLPHLYCKQYNSRCQLRKSKNCHPASCMLYDTLFVDMLCVSPFTQYIYIFIYLKRCNM